MGKRIRAEVAKLADAQDLKSCDPLGRAGSIPALGTRSHWVYGLTQVTEARAIFSIVPEIVPVAERRADGRDSELVRSSRIRPHNGTAPQTLNPRGGDAGGPYVNEAASTTDVSI